MAKTLCKYKGKEITKEWDRLVKAVADPRYLCSKCARAAHFKTYLCKPEKL